MEFSRYQNCANAISDILQDTWKEMTILSFCCECLDVWFVIPGKGRPTRRCRPSRSKRYICFERP